jgi:hypothetical protein
MNRQVGQRVIPPASIGLRGVPVLVDPQQGRVPLVQVSADGAVRYESSPLERPGVYTLETGQKRYPIAVNLPADEADVRTLDGPALRQALGGVDLRLLGDQLPPPSGGAGGTSDWSRGLMLGLLGLVALEGIMAMRFGHARRR